MMNTIFHQSTKERRAAATAQMQRIFGAAKVELHELVVVSEGAYIMAETMRRTVDKMVGTGVSRDRAMELALASARAANAVFETLVPGDPAAKVTPNPSAGR